MNLRTVIRALLIAAALLLAPVPVAVQMMGPHQALAQSGQNEALKARKRANIIPYGQIRSRAQRQFGGRVVGQQVREMAKGRWVYELRILQDDGKVISVVMDAHTGQVLGSRGRR